MAVDYRNGVSILLLIFCLPALAIATLLTIRHGFSKSSGWRFMIIFTLARVICACLELATINQPRNVSLYIGYAVLIGIAVSPLELVAFGLLSRVTTRITESQGRSTIITPRHIQFFELLNTVGIILSIIGGVKSGEDLSSTGHYSQQTLSKVGLALFIASFVAILATTVLLYPSISHADSGEEKRILLAVAVSLPLLLVRLVYSSAYTFGGVRSFSALNGSVTILLCVALWAEMGIVIVYEGAGGGLRNGNGGAGAGRKGGRWNEMEVYREPA